MSAAGDKHGFSSPHAPGWLKLVCAVIWFLLFVSALTLWWRSGIPLRQLPQLIESWLQQFGVIKAALIYILFYTVRPLIFFPASLLTIASGLVFGPLLCILFTIIGENASANVAFSLARWLGRDLIVAGEEENALVAKWDRRLRENGLVTVLVMRLIYLPFDLVNFSCGLTAMRHRDYAIGTFIGILPALIAFVLFRGVVAADNRDRALTLGLAVFFFLLGLGIAHLVRKREHPELGDE